MRGLLVTIIIVTGLFCLNAAKNSGLSHTLNARSNSVNMICNQIN